MSSLQKSNESMQVEEAKASEAPSNGCVTASMDKKAAELANMTASDAAIAAGDTAMRAESPPQQEDTNASNPKIDEALDMSALPSERGKKRMRPENVKTHFNSPMRKFTGAVLNFYVDKCETTLYELQAMAKLVWGRTLTLPEVLDIAIFGHPCKPSTWTFVERGFWQAEEWSYSDKLEQDVDASQNDIMLLRPCPSTEKWGPVVAEYYGYKFEFDLDYSSYYYLRLCRIR